MTRKPKTIAIWEGNRSVARIYASLQSDKPVIGLHGGTLADVKKLKKWLDKTEAWMKANPKKVAKV